MPDNLPLSRPLVFLDIETTGLDVLRDRIVEIALIKVQPGGQQEEWHRLVHPGRPIPPAATAIHGIDDARVANEPSFARLAPEILQFLGQADLCGFGISRLDLPLLEQEFHRCGKVFNLAQRAQVDLMKIYHQIQPRNLSAAVRDYLQRDHLHAHSALQDALVCVDLLQAMLLRHDHLARELTSRMDRNTPSEPIWCSQLVYHNGQPYLNFGRHNQRALAEVVKDDPAYLRWMLTQSFPENLKQLIRQVLPSPANDLNESSYLHGDTV